MKITRRQLRQIIKEEISRIVENMPPDVDGESWTVDDEGVLVSPEIEIQATPGAKLSPSTSPEGLAFLNKVTDAANELAPGFSDPLDALAEKFMEDEISLEDAQSEAMEVMDLLAQLDNAAEIGVIQAAELLGL